MFSPLSSCSLTHAKKHQKQKLQTESKQEGGMDQQHTQINQKQLRTRHIEQTWFFWRTSEHLKTDYRFYYGFQLTLPMTVKVCVQKETWKTKVKFHIFAYQILVMSSEKSIHPKYSQYSLSEYCLCLFVSCTRQTLSGKVLQSLLHCYRFNNFIFYNKR